MLAARIVLTSFYTCFYIQGPWAVRAVLRDAVSCVPSFVHPEVLVAPEQSGIPLVSVLSMVPSFRRSGMGVPHVGVDVGAGDAEVDLIYISFIVSVQYIGFLWTTEQQLDNN